MPRIEQRTQVQGRKAQAIVNSKKFSFVACLFHGIESIATVSIEQRLLGGDTQASLIDTCCKYRALDVEGVCLELPWTLVLCNSLSMGAVTSHDRVDN